MSHGETLVRALEMVSAILESRPQNVSGNVWVSPQHALKDLVEPLWHHRRGRFVHLRHLALLFAADGPLEGLAKANGWHSEFLEAQRPCLEAVAALNCVRYFRTETAVRLGDHVRLRVFFKRTEGRVTYLPGVSPANAEIDFGGICRVGIQTEDGSFVSCHVDGDALDLKKGIVFLRRDTEAVPPVPSEEELAREV